MTRRREGWHAQAAAAQVAAQSGRQLAACGTCLEGARRRRRPALAPPLPSLLLPAPPSSLSRQGHGRLPHGRRCHRRRPYGRLSRQCSVETPSPRSPSVLLRGLGVTVARFRPTHAALEASRAEPRGRWRPMGHLARVGARRRPAQPSFELVYSLSVCQLFRLSRFVPDFDVSGKTAEPKMAFNFAHLLSAACGGAPRRLGRLRRPWARCARLWFGRGCQHRKMAYVYQI